MYCIFVDEWLDNYPWIALRYSGSGMQWFGNNTGYMSSVFAPMFPAVQPKQAEEGNCVLIDESHYDGFWTYWTCTYLDYFVCQRG